MKKYIQSEGTSTTFYDTKRITWDQQKNDERKSTRTNDVLEESEEESRIDKHERKWINRHLMEKVTWFVYFTHTYIV